MSTPTPAAGARRSVATYSNYREAERAVDQLSDAGFPVERVAIVGSGLQTVEQVTSRMTTGRAALMGAGQGAIIGVFFALLFGLFFTGPGFFGLLVYAVVLSAGFGAIFGAMAHAASGGRRDFASVSQMRADRYEVMVDHEVADRATQILGGAAPTETQPATPEAPRDAPPAGSPEAPTETQRDAPPAPPEAPGGTQPARPTASSEAPTEPQPGAPDAPTDTQPDSPPAPRPDAPA